jgi:hypothetical protein
MVWDCGLGLFWVPGQRAGPAVVHLLADTGCRPLARLTSAGQRH